jgi:hypothetical protein
MYHVPGGLIFTFLQKIYKMKNQFFFCEKPIFKNISFLASMLFRFAPDNNFEPYTSRFKLGGGGLITRRAYNWVFAAWN